MMLEKAVNGLKGSYINKSATDVKEITGVDAVSGATYSSNAIRDAILNALELKQESLTFRRKSLQKVNTA